MWKNRTALLKTCIFRVFHIVRYPNVKIYERHSIWGNDITLKETFDLRAFERVRYQNAKNHVK